MASFLTFSDGPPGLKIEVEEGGAPFSGANPSLAALIDTIGAIAARAAASVTGLPAEQRPTDLVIDFGVQALPTGDFAITRETTTANLRVSLTWSQQPADESPEAGPLGLLP